MSTDAEYARETIKLIRELSEDVIRLRQEVTRATAPLFPRVIGIERRLDHQDAVLEAQNKALVSIESRVVHLEAKQDKEHAERVWGQERNFKMLTRAQGLLIAVVVGVTLVALLLLVVLR